MGGIYAQKMPRGDVYGVNRSIVQRMNVVNGFAVDTFVSAFVDLGNHDVFTLIVIVKEDDVVFFELLETHLPDYDFGALLDIEHSVAFRDVVIVDFYQFFVKIVKAYTE